MARKRSQEVESSEAAQVVSEPVVAEEQRQPTKKLMVEVQSINASFWRCGLQFTRVPTLLDPEALSPEIIKRLQAEHKINLVVAFKEV